MSCTTADTEIHQGATAPYTLRYTVTTDNAAFDLTTVSAAEFSVKRQAGGDAETWSASISAATTTSIVLTHTFATGEVDDVELLIIQPHLTIPAGELIAEPKNLQVKALFT